MSDTVTTFWSRYRFIVKVVTYIASLLLVYPTEERSFRVLQLIRPVLR